MLGVIEMERDKLILNTIQAKLEEDINDTEKVVNSSRKIYDSLVDIGVIEYRRE